MRTASESDAGRLHFVEGLVQERLSWVRAEEKRLDLLRDKTYALEEDAQQRKTALLTEARAEAERIVKAAEEQAAKMLSAGETQAHAMRSLALPPAPRPGGGELVADVVKETIQTGLNRTFDFLQRSLEVNPQAAGDVARTAARVVEAVMPGSGSPTAGAADADAAAPPSGADPLDTATMGEFNKGIPDLPGPVLQAIIERHQWKDGDFDGMTVAFIKDVVRACRAAVKAPHA